MSSEFFLFYAEANIVCIIIFLYLVFRDLVSHNRTEKQIKFDYSLIAHILYFCTDVVWAGILFGRFSAPRFVVVLLNFANFVFISILAYEWFLFAAASLDMPLRKTRKGMWLIRLPFLVMTVAMVTAYIAAPEFWISPSGELNLAYHPMMLAAPLFYVFASGIYSLSRAFRKENYARRKDMVLIGLYPFSVVFFGLMQPLVLNAPMFCFGTTLMMLFFYVQSLDDMISVDPLTGLNNRTQIMRYAASEDRLRRGDPRAFVLMADIDLFKQINDTFGHAEGDKALVIIAGVLKKAVGRQKNPVFIGRFGGDEFILIARVPGEEAILSLIADIRDELEKARAENSLPYRLSISIGYDELNEGETFPECFERADMQLYRDKEANKPKSIT